MKNLTTMLQKGNIKPKDRVKLLVADMASKERDGKELLSKADRHALSEGWTPKDNEEVREYNSYNEAWKSTAYAEMDAQTTYLQATNGLLRANKYIDMILYRGGKGDFKNGIADKTIEVLQKKEDAQEALNLTLGYLGFELDYLVYLYAYELAGEELQKDLLALYPDAKTERDYLEQEETIFNLFNGKETLTQKAKEELAELIAIQAFNRYLGELDLTRWYAGISLLDIAKVLAKDMDIKYNPDSKALHKELENKITDYATDNKTTPKELIKETVLASLNNEKHGLLTVYQPLFLSNEKATCNETDTGLTHKEVFNKWLEVKGKAKEEIQKLVGSGKLKVEKRQRDYGRIRALFVNLTEEVKKEIKEPIHNDPKDIVTGESLYNLEGDYQFIKDFRKQAEEFKVFGALVLFLRGCSFVKDYATLLAFEILFEELSKTFGTDLTYSIKKWIAGFEYDIELLKMDFLMLADEITQGGYESNRVYYMTESYIDELLATPFDTKTIKPDIDGRVSTYANKIKDNLGRDFTNPFETNEK